MLAKMHSGFIYRLLIALLACSLLLAACSPAINITVVPPQPVTVVPEITVVFPTLGATNAPPATPIPPVDGALAISLNTGSIATSYVTDVVPAVDSSANGPYWDLLPEYTSLTLQNYPISRHNMMPQIFIYPAQVLGKVNDGAGKIVASLQSLLTSQQDIPKMPFMPLINAAQVMHSKLEYLDFKNGKGLRYLTQFDQALLPINNNELIYTYQGLTSDGKYYVAAVMPVNHPSLPMNVNVTGNEPPEFRSDFPLYLANVVNSLTSQPSNSFTPDLTQLDAVLSSLEIK